MGLNALSSADRKNSRENSFMVRDSIVDEVRRVRESLAARYDFDVKAILAASKKRQARSTRKVVSLVPKESWVPDPTAFGYTRNLSGASRWIANYPLVGLMVFRPAKYYSQPAVNSTLRSETGFSACSSERIQV
jgi:hypothetical protein